MIGSMAQWVQWHDRINGTIRSMAQCRNRFNSKMGLMAQWDKWHSRSDGVNGRIRIRQRHKPSSKYKGFMFVTLVGFYTNLC